jgi:hypothetical protein
VHGAVISVDRARNITRATPARLPAGPQSRARLLDHVPQLELQLLDAPLELVDPP